VLSGVRNDMRIAREDVPGPVLVVSEAASEEAAIAEANGTSLGLGASVWTADRYKARRIAAELRVGMVWVNDHLVTRAAPEVPWGGVRGAGLGRARGAIALRTCAEPKVVTWDPPQGRPWWWFPYDAGLVKAGRTVARMRSARDADREAGLKEGALPTLRVAARALRRGSRSA
jgi:Aldehyde dehydrogenase family